MRAILLLTEPPTAGVVLGFLSIVISMIALLVAIYYRSEALKRAEKANKISEDALLEARKANEISVEALKNQERHNKAALNIEAMKEANSEKRKRERIIIGLRGINVVDRDVKWFEKDKIKSSYEWMQQYPQVFDQGDAEALGQIYERMSELSFNGDIVKSIHMDEMKTISASAKRIIKKYTDPE